MTDDLKTVSTHRTVLEAELVKNLLVAEGIEAFIHAPHAHDLYPGVLGEVMLQVRDRDVEDALKVLKDSQSE
jgi:hypothetical protein